VKKKVELARPSGPREKKRLSHFVQNRNALKRPPGGAGTVTCLESPPKKKNKRAGPRGILVGEGPCNICVTAGKGGARGKREFGRRDAVAQDRRVYDRVCLERMPDNEKKKRPDEGDLHMIGRGSSCIPVRISHAYQSL